MLNSRQTAGRWALAATCFVLLAAAADAVWTRCIDRSDTFEAGKVWRCLYAKENSISIFGASTTRKGIIPEMLSVDAFNYAMNGSSYDVVDVLLAAELKKNKKTPIIIGMYYEPFHKIGDVTKFVPFAWRSDVRHVLEKNHVMSWRFWIPAIRYFGYYDWYLKDFLSERSGATRKVVKGYEHKLNALAFDAGRFAEAVRKRQEIGFTFSEDESDKARLLHQIQSAPNRTFVLLYPPMHRSCIEMFAGKDKFEAALSEWRKIPNVVVLDYSGLQYPDEYFEDTVHLNERGATEFTRLFSSDLDCAINKR